MINQKVTKQIKLKEINNERVHNFYYLIYGRIYNETKTKYIKYKYVMCFDIFDLQEYFEKEIITKNDIKQYLNEIENCYITYIKDFEDKKAIQEFINYCNETIADYNSVLI